MILFINGLPAAIAEGTTFKYLEENRFFEDSNGYTLDIELPLKGCVENRKIFGFIERNPPEKAEWNASIRCDGLIRSGSLMLVSVSRDSLRAQFIAGKYTLDFSERDKNTYINRLHINDTIYIEDGSKLPTAHLCASIDYITNPDSPFQSSLPITQPRGGGNFMQMPAIALPWINADTGMIQNGFDRRESFIGDIYASSCGISWMPYLLSMAKAIAAGAGYSFDFSEWENSDLRHLVIFNALPCPHKRATIYNCGAALPHWTIKEFFDNISPVLGGIFDVNGGTITFYSCDSFINSRPIVTIDDIDDEYSVTAASGSDESDEQYADSKKYKYTDPGTEEWKFQECSWVPQRYHAYNSMEFDTAQDALDYMKENKDIISAHGNVYFARDIKVWFAFYNVMEGESYYIQPMAINLFSTNQDLTDGEEESYTELKTVPVNTDYNGLITLNPDGAVDAEAGESDTETGTAPLDESYQTPIVDAIVNGKPDNKDAYYDVLYVGYWDGSHGKKLSPDTKGFDLNTSLWTIKKSKYSLRLSDKSMKPFNGLPGIDDKTKYTFTIYADEFPDINAIFLIHGKKYICKRLESEITETGMSKRIQGEFYRIKSDIS